MSVELSFNFDEEMGISEEEVIKIALKVYEKEREKAKEEINKTRLK